VVGSCFYYDTFPKGEHLFVVLAPVLDQDDMKSTIPFTMENPLWIAQTEGILSADETELKYVNNLWRSLLTTKNIFCS
jgi:hypothetical protein